MQHIVIPAREAHYKNSTLQCDALHTLGQHFSHLLLQDAGFILDIMWRPKVVYRTKVNRNVLTFNCIDATYIFVADVKTILAHSLNEKENILKNVASQTVSLPH